MAHLTAKEPDIFLRSWWRPATNESEYWTYIHQVTQAQLQMNSNVAPEKLDL